VFVSIVINGVGFERDIEPRLLLSDFIRGEAGLTGTHVGCEYGVCGACTVQVDRTPVRSCLMLAVQADGHEVRTVEGLAGPNDPLTPLQRAFHEEHALQCGFCTPAFLMSLEPVLRPDAPVLAEDELREAVSGVLCRCTGYGKIVSALRRALAGTGVA
jgi:carbon-monoxide dehydrogenase small subunit/2-furoyl-CoA dehydrogenase 2Fe-2S iron sulfur subunit